MSSKQSGYTLLGVIFALLIISSALTAGALRFRAGLMHQVLRGDAERAAAFLALAEQLAAASGREVVVKRRGERQISMPDTSGRQAHLEFSKHVSIRSFRFSASAFGPDAAVFYPNGFATAGSLVLEHRSSGRCTVVQSLLGARRVSCEG